MKAFATIVASSLFLAAPAFADSVIIQTPDANAGVVVSPPVAAAPAPVQTYQKDQIKESGDGMNREEKHTTETVTPDSSSKTTTKVEQHTDD